MILILGTFLIVITLIVIGAIGEWISGIGSTSDESESEEDFTEVICDESK